MNLAMFQQPSTMKKQRQDHWAQNEVLNGPECWALTLLPPTAGTYRLHLSRTHPITPQSPPSVSQVIISSFVKRNIFNMK